MPIYEYNAISDGCGYCRRGFEVLQKIGEDPLDRCPKCRGLVRRVPSPFRACVAETPEEAAKIESKIRDYEQEGMWSHAAETADKAGLDERAREDYKKAGYDM
ncbi:MAG: zinc ribbon domain-containing protein [Chloroflexi bacterium]|nr:zinc ribbon domain-containing protein [Chloroflexota bacterium]MBM3172400.1 zinc ribbon domain-containing protein [Chloroflexota bacterium]MBM3174116.1 zinc ribbon domain-containing protein [Chloroflexota bacterium]MBM4449184.1 zinc ribbon domain-containing protein [Chloroflexota bacterium]